MNAGSLGRRPAKVAFCRLRATEEGSMLAKVFSCAVIGLGTHVTPEATRRSPAAAPRAPSPSPANFTLVAAMNP